MNQKRILLVFVFIVISLMSCGKDSTSSSASGSTTSTSNGLTQGKEDPTELTLLMDSNMTSAGIDAVIALAEEQLNLKIKVEVRPGGIEGDNVVKTRLASGDMADLCVYNSGSLLEAINPQEYFIDLVGTSFIDKLDDTYEGSVTVNGSTYGIPVCSTQAGGILYSKPLYKELGLSVPKTWDEFIANCDALQAAGKTAIYGAFAESWTAQVLYLGDHYNVTAEMPNFPEEFQAGRVKYETNPAGLRSWEKLEDTVPYYNADKLAATYADACDVMANGEAGHWVMLTQALSNIYELYGDTVNDIGVFGIPGDDPNNQGLTLWMPLSIYGNKLSDKREAILEFMEFYISYEALDAYTSAVLPDGPYCVKGYEIPENAYEAVRLDMQPYFDQGKTELALEFETAVKGPNCSQISQEIAVGGTTALEAARAYDQDCLKQAMQLGFDWE